MHAAQIIEATLPRVLTRQPLGRGRNFSIDPPKIAREHRQERKAGGNVAKWEVVIAYAG